MYIANPTHVKVAKGTVHNSPTITLHNCPMPLDHVKVSVDKVLVGDAPLPVPIENVNILIVYDAVGAFVAWPKSLVSVPNMVC